MEVSNRTTTVEISLVRGVGFEPTKAFATGYLLCRDLKSSTVSPSWETALPL